MYSLVEPSVERKKTPSRKETVIVRAHESTLVQCGQKAHNLSLLLPSGFAIPQWFTISADAFWQSLTATAKFQLRTATTEEETKVAIATLKLPELMASQIISAAKRAFGAEQELAVRSSAIDEDGVNHSFAGQMESILNVKPDDLAQAIVQVWRSAFSAQNFQYRQLRNLSVVPNPPAVLIQKMVAPRCAGVAFSCDPVSGARGVCVINAVDRLADSLVQGQVSGETLYVARSSESVLRSRIGMDYRSSLKDAEAKKIAAMAEAAEGVYGAPQDIEWAVEENQVYLLQCRPITALAATGRGTASIWDNSNIGESYQGVTTPLTFSFARIAYENVYRQFCRMMGVPQKQIEAQSHIFPNMIGFCRGRIYYNLVNWYRLLSILPGFKTNRAFMEQMMGVSEPLPPSVVAEVLSEISVSTMTDRILLSKSLLRSSLNYLRLPAQVTEFNRRFEAALSTVPNDLSALNIQQLARLYNNLEHTLLPHWDAPLTNDFFAMIFYGVLRKLCLNWCHDQNGTLQNSLVSDISGVISSEPAVRMRRLADIAASDGALTQTLAKGTLADISSAISKNEEFQAEYKDYLAKFGDRCAGELKLETETLHDNPMPLLRSVANMAKTVRTAGLRTSEGTSGAIAEHDDLSETIAKAVSSIDNPVNRLLFRWVLSSARTTIRQRENLRFQRTRLFATVRRIFKEIGLNFYREDLLDSPDDIFFLEVCEVFAYINRTATTAKMKSLVQLRKGEFLSNMEGLPPANRFQCMSLDEIPASTYGLGGHGGQASDTVTTATGIGCSPGKVTGRVRVLRDPALAEPLQKDEIVVAERTDPGWILVFPQAAGLLVQYGTLLSHSAIVSRELGLAAIVSVPNVTEWLKDGDLIEMDGATGVVHKLAGYDQKQESNQLETPLVGG